MDKTHGVVPGSIRYTTTTVAYELLKEIGRLRTQIADAEEALRDRHCAQECCGLTHLPPKIVKQYFKKYHGEDE